MVIPEIKGPVARQLIARVHQEKAGWFNKRFHGYLHTIFGAGEATTAFQRRIPEARVMRGVLIVTGTVIEWFWSRSAMKQLRETILARPAWTRQWRQRSRRDFLALRQLFQQAERLQIPDLSDAQLLAWHRKLYDGYANHFAIALMLESFHMTADDNWVEAMIVDELRGKTPEDQWPDIMHALLAPTVRSIAFSEHVDIARLALLKRQSPAKFKQALRRHQQKYYWIENNYFVAKVLTKTPFNSKVNSVLREHGNNLAAYVRAEQLRLTKNKQTKRRLIRQYGLSKRLATTLDLIDDFSAWQDLRKSCVQRQRRSSALENSQTPITQCPHG